MPEQAYGAAPANAIRVVDKGVNTNYVSTGIGGTLDKDQADNLRLVLQNTLRQIEMRARNDGEDGDVIPLIASCVPDFLGSYFEADDFNHYDDTATVGDWTKTDLNTSSGTVAVIDGAGGLLEIDVVSNTADEGMQIQRHPEAFLLAADKKLVFAARFKITDVITGCQAFVGLANLDTSMFASGEPTMSDYIGFSLSATSQAGGGDYTAGSMVFSLYDGSSVELVESSFALTEDEFIIAGFVVDGVTTATPFTMTAAGVVTLGTAITISDPPDAEMTPSFTLLNEDGSTDPIMVIDWYYCWQTR